MDNYGLTEVQYAKFLRDGYKQYVKPPEKRIK